MSTIMIKEQLSKADVKFEDFFKKAEEIADKRVDYVVNKPYRNIRACTDGSLSFVGQCGANSGVTKNEEMTPWAMSQLSIKLGMPSGYAEKCLEHNHGQLFADNINTWLGDMDGKRTSDWLVREFDNRIDAMLTSRYAIFDSHDVLTSVKKAINVNDYHVVGSYMSDERMHLRLIKDSMLNVDGEDLYPGIFIDSSDVGRTALNISFGIWKQVCSNGLCINKIGGVLYRQRHIGITSLEVEEELIAKVKMIPAMIEQSEKIIKAAAAEKMNLNAEETFNQIVDKIRRAATVNEAIAKRIIEIAQNNYSATRWGIVNAMTEIAQEFELDKRIQIEQAAGQLITA